jgi:hypothetical protein
VDAEHRPKKGDDDYVKRPENAFFLFRRHCCAERQLEEASSPSDKPQKKERQADMSRTISSRWKALSESERAYWIDLAKQRKREHEEKYPNYRYRPSRAKDKANKEKRDPAASFSITDDPYEGATPVPNRVLQQFLDKFGASIVVCSTSQQQSASNRSAGALTNFDSVSSRQSSSPEPDAHNILRVGCSMSGCQYCANTSPQSLYHSQGSSGVPEPLTPRSASPMPLPPSPCWTSSPEPSSLYDGPLTPREEPVSPAPLLSSCMMEYPLQLQSVIELDSVPPQDSSPFEGLSVDWDAVAMQKLWDNVPRDNIVEPLKMDPGALFEPHELQWDGMQNLFTEEFGDWFSVGDEGGLDVTALMEF